MNAEKYSHIVIHHGMHLIGSMTMDDDPKHTADAVKSYLDRNTQSCIISSCTTACFQLSLFLSCHFEFCIPPKISYDFILSFRLSLLFIVNSPNLSFPAHLCCCCLISFSVLGVHLFLILPVLLWYLLSLVSCFPVLCPLSHHLVLLSAVSRFPGVSHIPDYLMYPFKASVSHSSLSDCSVAY